MVDVSEKELGGKTCFEGQVSEFCWKCGHEKGYHEEYCTLCWHDRVSSESSWEDEARARKGSCHEFVSAVRQSDYDALERKRKDLLDLFRTSQGELSVLRAENEKLKAERDKLHGILADVAKNTGL